MLITLRLIHILSGAFWIGAALFNVILLVPTIRALGPAAGPVMQHLVQVRKLPTWLLGAGVITFLSGLSLYHIASDGFSNGFMASGPGKTFGLGAVFALLAILTSSEARRRDRRITRRQAAVTRAGRAAPGGAEADRCDIGAGDAVRVPRHLRHGRRTVRPVAGLGRA